MDLEKNKDQEKISEVKLDEEKIIERNALFDQIPEDVLSEFSEELSEPTMGIMTRIINIFTSPREVMEDVKIKPYTAMLVLIFAFIGLITTLPVLSIMKDGMLDAMIQQSGDTANIDSAMFDSILNYTVIFTVIATAIGSAIAPLVSGLVSHVIAILAGGEGKLKQTVGINTMAYTVIMAGAIIRVGLVLVTKNMYASFSPAMLLGSNPTLSPYYGVLSVIEIFNLVYLYFVFIGIKVVHNVSSVRAWIITLLPTVFVILLSLIPVLLF